jgi:cytosine/adenosine deaminase-related metal-dependent hydrolase
MLGSTLDPCQLFDAGRVALGSDSRLTGSRDLLDELRVAAASCDLIAQELLRLVTANAADVLRMPFVGGLEIGQSGDCVILRAESDPHAALLRASRSTIRAVVRRGAPVIGDPDFEDWFAHCGIDTVGVNLDGQPKLIDRRAVMALEPGLEITQRP